MKQLLLIPCLAAALPAAGATFNVNSTADSVDAIPGNGVCADARGRCTLRAAVMEANAYRDNSTDTIFVPNGVYLLTRGQLTITSTMVIRGASMTGTIIDAGGIPVQGHRAFDVTSAANGVQLRTLTIRNGFVTYYDDPTGGGCIRNAGGLALNSVTLNYCGTDSDGGAILNTGRLTIQGSKIVDSGVWAEGGSSVANLSNATLVMTRSRVSNSGGLALGNRGSLQITDSTLEYSEWTPFQNGGALANLGAAIVKSSTFAHNGSPGVVIENRGTMTLVNCTVSDNSAPAIGNFADLTLQNTTIYGNPHSDELPGGLINGPNANTKVKNSIIARNTDSVGGEGWDCSGRIASLNYSLIGNTRSCTIPAGSGNLLNVDPRLGPLANNGGKTQTHALLAGSLAIDTGSPAAPGSGGNACERTDQRGVLRPHATNCDMGSYERRPGVPHSPEVPEDPESEAEP